MDKIKKWLGEKFIHFKSDFIAGLIVAIVALPLAIGFSIASGVPPIMGIYAAIIGGIIASIFGGSEFQISGPTGAMVVIILGVSSKYGVDGLILATLLAGIILLLLWLFKLGKAIEYIPHPVIIGFTAGIAVLIFFGQLNNFLGINPTYPHDAGFLTKTIISFSQLINANIYAVILTFITLLILIYMKKISKKIPGSIVAVILGLIVAFFFKGLLHLKTVGDIGAIPQGIPIPHIPTMTWDLIVFVLPAAATIAALAAIESLLSAVVADGMTGRKHDSNKELRGQGLANIASALFGGLPVTGAIARTATNIRNGGKTRLVGIIHALILLLILLALGSVFALIPLAVIAGILMFVAFNMVEWHLIQETFYTPLSDITIMFLTFLLTVLVDLTLAIEVGIIFAALLFMKRMGDLYKIEEHMFNDPDESKITSEIVQKFHHPDISIYTFSGPLFFGAASRLEQELSNTPGSHKPIKIIRMKYVSVIDASGIAAFKSIIYHHKNRNGVILLSTVQPNVYKLLDRAGVIHEIGKKNIFKRTSHAFKEALIDSHRMHNELAEITEEDIKKYDLSLIDADDSHIMLINDKDPVHDMLNSSGLTGLHEKTVRVGKRSKDTIKKLAVTHQENLDTAKKELIESSPIKNEKLNRMGQFKLF